MAITVECPSCSSSFPVDPNKIPEGGVKARCSSCAHIFLVERPAEEPAAPPEPEEEPAEPAAAEEEEAPAFEAPAVEEPEEEPAEEAAAAVEETAEEGSADDWVFETEEDVDPDSLDIEPMETVESEAAEAVTDTAVEEPQLAGPALGEAAPAAEEAPPATEEPAVEEEPEEEALAGEAPVVEDEEAGVEPLVAPEEEGEADPSEGVAPDSLEPSEPVQGFTFGKRDPKDKAKRLARVLVSDMIMYNPERHERALENDTLKEDFEEEIEKSWKEYVEQVGDEMAESTDFWREALNEVLAKGEEVF